MSSLNHSRITNIGLIVAGLCIVTLTGVSAHKWKNQKSPTDQVVPSIKNTSLGLRISAISVGQGPVPDVTITLVNESGKNINGYVIGISNLSITTDFASVGTVMEPGAVRQETFPLSNFAAMGTKEVRIAALSFEGLTGDGEPFELQLMLDRHKALKEGVDLVLPLLRELKSDFSPANSARTEQLVSTALLRRTRPRESPAFNEGRQWISDQFREKSTAARDKTSVEEMITFFEQIRARL